MKKLSFRDAVVKAGTCPDALFFPKWGSFQGKGLVFHGHFKQNTAFISFKKTAYCVRIFCSETNFLSSLKCPWMTPLQFSAVLFVFLTVWVRQVSWTSWEPKNLNNWPLTPRAARADYWPVDTPRTHWRRFCWHFSNVPSWRNVVLNVTFLSASKRF